MLDLALEPNGLRRLAPLIKTPVYRNGQFSSRIIDAISINHLRRRNVLSSKGRVVAQKDKVAIVIEEEPSGKPESRFENIGKAKRWMLVDCSNRTPELQPLNSSRDVRALQKLAHGFSLGNEIYQHEV